MPIIRGGCNRCNKSPCICSPTPEDRPKPPIKTKPVDSVVESDADEDLTDDLVARGADPLDYADPIGAAIAGLGGAQTPEEYARNLRRGELQRMAHGLLVTQVRATGRLPVAKDVKQAFDAAELFYTELRERTSS